MKKHKIKYKPCPICGNEIWIYDTWCKWCGSRFGVEEQKKVEEPNEVNEK